MKTLTRPVRRVLRVAGALLAFAGAALIAIEGGAI